MKNYFKDIAGFIKDFKNRKGGYIFTATILSKFLGFALSVFAINLISPNEYGLIAYAYNIIGFITPFAGFGIFQSLNRYGPLSKSQNDKKKLFQYVLKSGLIASTLLTIVFLMFTKLIAKSLPNSYNYLIVISLLIFSEFFFLVIKIYFRIHNFNKIYAYLEIISSFLLIILGLVFTFIWGGYGYIIAIIISPLIISIYVIVKYKLLTPNIKNDYTLNYKKSLWVYGLYTSFGGLTSQLLFSVDILTIGFLIHDPTQIAIYKAASLIPFALFFIPSSILKTDLVKITKNYKNKVFLKNYVNSYFKTLLIISVSIGILLYSSSSIIMSIYGSSYSSGVNLISVFAVGLVGAFLFRIPFGNILTAIGWAKFNTIISIIILILDFILNIILVQKFGIIGAAYSTSILLWVSGIVSYIVFKKYLNTLEKI